MIFALTLLAQIWVDLPPAPITAPLPPWQWADQCWHDRFRSERNAARFRRR